MAQKCGVCERPVSMPHSKCADCGKPRCARHRVSYVDGNNGSITKHAKEYCLACFQKHHPEQWY